MWLAVLGANGYSRLRMDVEIISIDLSTLFACSSSNMSVSPTVLCDGLYHCNHYEDELACRTGNDPSDIQSGITTIDGYINYEPDDVYADTNEMWLAVIGANGYSGLRMVVEIISIDLSTLFACSSSNMSVSTTVLCDGLYHCDHYEDELACNYSATYLQEGKSHFISLPRTYTTRFYNAIF
eukprot:XP_011670716.1 PREDICTED: uncharacterized protein LOC105441358 [Strongylocentrotus purpuratus]